MYLNVSLELAAKKKKTYKTNESSSELMFNVTTVLFDQHRSKAGTTSVKLANGYFLFFFFLNFVAVVIIIIAPTHKWRHNGTRNDKL